MPVDVKPRRSVLYMPGSNPRALEKAKSLAADALIFDLEDAVAPDAKEAARGTIADALKTGGYGQRELLLRVNAADTPWNYQDLAAAAAMPLNGVILPKVDSAATVRQAASILSSLNSELPIWCMMETPLAMLHAAEIAGAHPRLAGFIMGTSDLAKDLHARHTADRLPLITGLGLCLLAARAYGLVILDGVHLDLDDEAGFKASCRQGLELGFDGKTLIHPKTIAIANEIFAPSEAELAQAHKFVDAYAQAKSAGKGVVVVDGKLVEQLHVTEAERVLRLGEMIAKISAA